MKKILFCLVILVVSCSKPDKASTVVLNDFKGGHDTIRIEYYKNLGLNTAGTFPILVDGNNETKAVGVISFSILNTQDLK